MTEALQRRVFEWIAPGLFGLGLFAAIKWHASELQFTLHGLVLCIFSVATALLLTLSRMGHHLTVPRGIRPLLVALAVSLVISDTMLSDPIYSLPRLTLYLSLVLLAIAIYVMYRDAAVLPLQAFCIAIAVSHIPLLVEVIVWLAHPDPTFFRGNARVPNFAHVRHFSTAGFLAAACGSGLVVLSPRLRTLSLFLAAAAVLGILATGTRGALLAWIAFVLLLACCDPARGRVAVHGVVVLALGLTVVWVLHTSGVLSSISIFTRLEQSGDPEKFDSGRLNVWMATVRVIAEHPLFGLGAEAYRLSGCCERLLSHPHNFVLQLLLQFGLVGNALLACIVWWAVRALGGLRQVLALTLASPENRVLAVLLATYFAYALIDGLLFHAVPMIHLALFSGLYAAGLHRARASGEPIKDRSVPRP